MNIQNLQQKKWYVIDRGSTGNYSHENPINFLTCSLESSLCDYSDAYVLVTGNIAAVGGDANTKVALKNCMLFRKHINIVAIIILILQEVYRSLKEMK